MPLHAAHDESWSTLTIDHPPRNELDRTLLHAIVATLDERAAAGAPPLLLRAVGKHFSTGYPIGEIPPTIFHRDPAVRAADPFEQVMDRLVHYPSPVVAAIGGDAYGGAVELLACADLRVAADHVRFGVPPARLGLVYSHTGLRRLVRSFGATLVNELLLTGTAIDAERARQAGFVNRLVPADQLLPAAAELLRAVARNPPGALRGTRRVLTLLAEAETLDDDALAEIAELRHAARASGEFEAARDAFLNRSRSPDDR
jgi:enoyl-CoA hydratase/carnithine racemase